MCRCGCDWRNVETAIANNLDLQPSLLISDLLDSTELTDRKRRNPLYGLRLDDVLVALSIMVNHMNGMGRRSFFASATPNRACHKHFTSAFLVFEDWPDSFHRMIEEVRKEASFYTDYDYLHQRLSDESIRPGINFIMLALESYFDDLWLKTERPYGWDQNTRRRFLKPSDVCLQLGVSMKQLHHLVQRQLIAVASLDGSNEKFLVDTQALEEFARQAFSELLVSDVCRALGITHEDVTDLMIYEFLVPTSGPTVDGLSEWRFSSESIASLIGRIRHIISGNDATDKVQELVDLDFIHPRLLTYQLGLGAFIKAVFDGNIMPLAEGPSRTGFKAIVEGRCVGLQCFLFSKHQILSWLRANKPSNIDLIDTFSDLVTFLNKLRKMQGNRFTRKQPGLYNEDHMVELARHVQADYVARQRSEAEGAC